MSGSPHHRSISRAGQRPLPAQPEGLEPGECRDAVLWFHGPQPGHAFALSPCASDGRVCRKTAELIHRLLLAEET